MAVAFALSGCAGGASTPAPAAPHGAPESHEEKPKATLDAEVKSLPGASARYVDEPTFKGQLYLLEVGPTHPPSEEAGKDSAATPPLVLVHGLGNAGLRDFYPILAGLAEHRRVIAFDLPGFARSTALAPPYDPKRYAEVLAYVIRTYAGGRADVLGHSMGGAIALEHSGRYPEQVHRLVLVDAAGILHKEAVIGHQIDSSVASAARVPTLPALPGMPPNVADHMQEIADDVGKSVEGAGRAFLSVTRPIRPGREALDVLAPKDVTTRAALALSDHEFSYALSESHAPTLLLWGRKDPFAPLRTGQMLACRLPEARLVVFDDVGHVPMQEATSRMLAEVLAHLDAEKPEVGAPCPPKPDSLLDESTLRIAECSQEVDFELTGVFDEVHLTGCAHARLQDVVTKRLAIDNSTVNGISVRVSDTLTAKQSRVVLTGAFLGGTIEANASSFDLAGVELAAKEPLRVDRRSTFLLSDCVVDGEQEPKPLHRFVTLGPGGTF